MDTAASIAARFKELSPQLDERGLRLYVASEAKAFGRGGVTLLHKITGMARSTIKRGQDELACQSALQATVLKEPPVMAEGTPAKPIKSKIRRPGAGRKTKEYHDPLWTDALEKLIDPITRGDPESSVRWTIKSTNSLSMELRNLGFDISSNTVMRKLHEMGYSLQSNLKILSEIQHPDRNAQFKYINETVIEFIKFKNPVISIDTKKIEILRNFKNKGQQFSLKSNPKLVHDHDFPAPSLPRALPFGIYDINKNLGHVVVRTDHDTSEFVTNSIYGWWIKYGQKLYSDATKILITADSRGSNGYRIHLWKYCLQNIVDKIKLPISIIHFPPGTSKWNIMEYKLFSFIGSKWRDDPLIDYETIVKLITSTKTATDLAVTCTLDYSEYQTGIKLTKEQISSINIKKEEFHGEWNYTIYPN
jgi:hypothetical protein